MTHAEVSSCVWLDGGNILIAVFSMWLVWWFVTRADGGVVVCGWRGGM